MSRFAKLAVTTVAATLVLVALGGFVRAMEAGLGCPDWPTCHGALSPPSSLGYGALKLAWIEHSHRLWAAFVILLICVQAVAVHFVPQYKHVRRACHWLVPAVLSQALIGAMVIWLKLDASSVVLHLAGALTVLALAVYVALHAAGRGRTAFWPAEAAPARLSLVTLLVTIGQMLLGSAVTGWSAGLAYGTFPSFNGSAVPPRVQTVPQVLHVAHRLTAYVVVALVVTLAVRSRRAEPLVRRTTWIAVGLVAVQVALGAMNIWFKLPAWSVAPHLTVGSWLVTALYVVTMRARWSAAGQNVATVATSPAARSRARRARVAA